MQGRSRTIRRTALSAVMALVVATLALLTIGAGPAQATHFRANQLTWHRVGATNDVEFHISGAWRCTGFFANCLSSPPAPGTAIPNPGPTGLTTGVLNPGQNGTITPSFTVVSVDTANDVVVGEAHVFKDYPGTQTGPWNVTFGECCRLSAPQHRNNPDKNMFVTSIVDVTKTSASPESSMTPVVDCKVNTICQFQVPAFDPDGNTLRYRLATSTEAAGTGAGSGFVQPGPPNSTNAASINATTGKYTWNTAGASLNPSGPSYFSTQVMVEELVGTTVVSKTAVDFFIRVNNSPNAAPVFVSPTPADGHVINTTVGSNVTFSVAATDADVNDTVTLGMTNKPAAATFLSSSGNPAGGTFSWNPSAAGTTIVNLTAQDQSGLGAVQRSITINVVNPSRDISVNDVTVNENAGTADFIVSLDSAAIGPISVQYLTFDGSATEPGDYSLAQGTLSFAAGESSKTVSVPIIDDNNPEPTETFDFRLANPVGGVIVDGLGVGTITDTDRAISINDVSVDESAGTATFTVTLASAAAAPLSVNYATFDGSATQPGDYTKTDGTLNFVPTDLTKTVTVPIVDDNNPESTETFEVRLSGASGGVITDGEGVGTITDTDRSIRVNDVTASENIGALTFTVSLDAPAVAPVTVDYATANDSATAPGDYVAKSGAVTFAAGEATKSVTVTLTNDDIPEPTETFELKLSNSVGGVIDDGTGVGTIIDSDRRVSVNHVTVDESAGTASFTVSLDEPAAANVSVNYSTFDDTANQPGDYTKTDGSLVFTPGEQIKTVSVPIIDDNAPEPTETFELRLQGVAGGVISEGTGVGTITDQDRRVSVSDVTVDESAGTASFQVTLDAAAVNPVSVNYATANGTGLNPAIQPGDYTSTAGTLTFAAGQATKTVSVPIVDDNAPEATETFELRLSGASGGVIADGTGIGTITDQDRRISVSDVTVDESAGSASFTVSLDVAAVNPVSVNYATANGTGLNPAIQPGDYTSTAGSLTFAAGQATKTVSVPIVDDNVPEAAETFELRLSGASGGTIVDGVGVGTITDKDARISVNDVTVNEAAGTASFTVSLGAAAAQAVSVDYATADGTATQPSDYTSASGSLNFAVGQTTKTVTVPIINDTADEPAETFTLNLSNAAGGAIVDGIGLGTIIDNDRNGAFYCRATGIRYTSEAVVANNPGTPCADDTKSALTVPLGPITASLVNAKTDQTPNTLIGTQPVNGDSGSGHSDTATVNFVQGAVSLRITAVVSDAKATCSNGQVVLTGSSSVSGLKLGNNLPYGVLRSYMKINVPGILSLEVNKQTKVGGKIIQQAVVITLLNGTPIVIGESIAGAVGNPCQV